MTLLRTSAGAVARLYFEPKNLSKEITLELSREMHIWVNLPVAAFPAGDKHCFGIY